MRILLILLLTVILGCTNEVPSSKNKILDFGSFTIDAPGTWTKKDVLGIDSYVGEIQIDSSEYLHFDLGMYSNDLTEYLEVQMPDGETYFINPADTSNNPTLIDSMDLSNIVKSKISWDTIDRRLAKILTQKRPGVGTTGIYFDSLWGAGRERDRFNLYGSNLKPSNELLVLKAFRTIKFYKDK